MFWQQMVNSISLGAMYSLLAIGYTMVYGIIKLINFAHGEIFMCGAFFTWWIMTAFSIPFPIAALMGIMLSTLLGIGVERIAYRPLRNESLLSDQAMCLSSIKKHAICGRFSVLDRTFQGQKHGCKDFGFL
jgi:branched-chain amino acid transport system permease protein